MPTTRAGPSSTSSRKPSCPARKGTLRLGRRPPRSRGGGAPAAAPYPLTRWDGGRPRRNPDSLRSFETTTALALALLGNSLVRPSRGSSRAKLQCCFAPPSSVRVSPLAGGLIVVVGPLFQIAVPSAAHRQRRPPGTRPRARPCCTNLPLPPLPSIGLQLCAKVIVRARTQAAFNRREIEPVWPDTKE